MDTAELTAADILDAIIDGQADAHLSAIGEALRQRQKALEARKRLDFTIGDRVIFNGSARPKYLTGVKATVTAINSTRVVLDVDENARAGRFSGQRNVRTPIGIIDQITEG